MATPTSPGQQFPPSKERFFRYFQHQVTDLQNEMACLSSTTPTGGERNDAFDHCLAGIARLSTEVKIASSYIPAYDQRTYAEAIRALGEKLQGRRKEVEPVRKFRFGSRKGGGAKAVVDEQVGGLGKRLGMMGEEKESVNGASSIAKLTKETTPMSKLVQTSGLSISNQNNTCLFHEFPETAATTVIVQKISNSVVNLSPSTSPTTHPFATATLKNITNSLILCGHTTGPIHITNVHNSTIVTACRQFRMHASKNVNVYLYCTSRPIIEACEDVRFAPVPAILATEPILSLPNQWYHIDDFGWLKTEPNPHYKLLGEGERVGEEVWREVLQKDKGMKSEEVLKAVGVGIGVGVGNES